MINSHANSLYLDETPGNKASRPEGRSDIMQVLTIKNSQLVFKMTTNNNRQNSNKIFGNKIGAEGVKLFLLSCHEDLGY